MLLILTAGIAFMNGLDPHLRADEAAAPNDEWSLIEGRLLAFTRRAAVPPEIRYRAPAGPDCMRRIPDPDAEVQALLDCQVTDPDSHLFGAFWEVKPANRDDALFPVRYFNPVRQLALAYRSPGSRFHEDPAVLDAIRRSFAYTRKHVFPGCDKPGGWWAWGRGIPDAVTDILVLVHEAVPTEDREYLLSILAYLVGDGGLNLSKFGLAKSDKDAFLQFRLGVITRDPDRILRAKNVMDKGVAPHLLAEDGTPLMSIIRPEFLGVCLPYTYRGYQAVVDWAVLARDTRFQLDPETTGEIVRYLLDLGRWNVFRETEVGWISFVAYQVFWRPPVRPNFSLYLARQLAGTDVPGAAELRARVAGETPPPLGCRYWPLAETMIFRPDPHNYCALVLASVPRTPLFWTYKDRVERTGNKWYYGRDGHLVLAQNDRECNPDLTYTTDWRQLTGVTRDDGSVLDSDQIRTLDQGVWHPAWGLCRNPMAGGVTLAGQDGVAGIEVRSGEVRARKSFFFLLDPRMVISLGSHIAGRGGTATIIHTVPIGVETDPVVLRNGAPVRLNEGRPTSFRTPCWLHVAGRGYFFPDRGTISAVVATREPDYSDFGYPPPGERNPHVAGPERFVSLFFDHGENPDSAAYACVYLLGLDPGDMPRLVTGLRRELVLGRDEAAHFVRYGPLTGAVFFRPGETEGFRTDRPCLLAIRREETGRRLALFDPSWEKTSLRLGLPKSVADGLAGPGVQTAGDAVLIEMEPGAPRAFRIPL